MTDKQFYSVYELAERYSRHTSSIWRWVAQGHLAPPIKLTKRTTRWRAEDIAAFERKSTDGAA